MYTQITDSDNIIDSRDILDRIGELQCLMEYANEEGVEPEEDDVEELEKLEELAGEGQNVAADWELGEILIHESYFTAYAEELARDIGAVGGEVEHWPLTHIDWEAAAEELKYDYSEVTFGTSTYYIR